MNETLLKNLRKIAIFYEILDDPRLSVVLDDGRRFLLRTDKKYDLIAIDALRTSTAYSNNIYSRQFFQLVKKHLKEDGVLLVWLDEHLVMPNTVRSVFDQLRVYSYFMLASNSRFEKKPERVMKLLAKFSPNERKLILAEGEYLGDQAYITIKADHYPINQDWKPVTEYYLGLRFREKFLPYK